MKLAMIVAMGENRVIGINNQMPWYLPNDLKYFKTVTMGKPVLMGRKTYESIGKPLPGRCNIIVSRDSNFTAQGCITADSLERAISIAQTAERSAECDEAVVIGGAEIYRLALPLVNRIYLTEVHAQPLGDAYFPELDRSEWQEIKRERFTGGNSAGSGAAAKGDSYDYSFVVLERSLPVTV